MLGLNAIFLTHLAKNHIFRRPSWIFLAIGKNAPYLQYIGFEISTPNLTTIYQKTLYMLKNNVG